MLSGYVILGVLFVLRFKMPKPTVKGIFAIMGGLAVILGGLAALHILLK